MLKVHSEPPNPMLPKAGVVLFALGFRPFFSAAAASAVAMMATWLAIWSGNIPAPGYYGFVGWHSHEMLFGYTSAIIAGFLLTAVRNWTGVNTPTGTVLALLALLWLAGRVLPLLTGYFPVWLIAAVDLAFLPMIALAIQPALWQGKQRINRIFVPILLAMALANLLVHLECLGLSNTASRGTDMMLYLVILLIALIGGRIMPFFTETAIPGCRTVAWQWVEVATMAGFSLLVLMPLLGSPPTLIGPLALAMAALQIIRLVGWHDHRVWRIPILWVLYTGMGWIVIGLLMLGLSALNVLSLSLAKHALAIGGIGVVTLGMIARVSLGHTGRPMQPVKAVEISFVLLNLTVFARVFGPHLVTTSYTFWVYLSGGLWILSFIICCVVYLPILFKPRTDGKAG